MALLSIAFDIRACSEDIIGSALVTPSVNGIGQTPFVIEKSRLRRTIMAYATDQLFAAVIAPSIDELCRQPRVPLADPS